MRKELGIFGEILYLRYLVSRIFRYEKHCVVLSTINSHTTYLGVAGGDAGQTRGHGAGGGRGRAR